MAYIIQKIITGDFGLVNANNIGENPDASYAVATFPPGYAESDMNRLTNVGLSIPSEATINGIEIESVAFTTAGTAGIYIKLTKANTEIGVPKQTEIDVSSDIRTFGASDDLWSTTWTPAEINASGFGAQFFFLDNSQALDLNVDNMKFNIYYSVPASGSPLVAQLTCLNRLHFLT